VLNFCALDKFKSGKFDRADFEKKVNNLRFARKLIKKMFFVSNVKPETIREAQMYLSELAYDIPLLKRPIPADFTRIARWIEHLKTPYAKWTAFASMIRADARSPDTALLAQFLHDAGSIIWFKDVRAYSFALSLLHVSLILLLRDVDVSERHCRIGPVVVVSRLFEHRKLQIQVARRQDRFAGL